jgi:NitT/TauT family transport system substrate-binding protein
MTKNKSKIKHFAMVPVLLLMAALFVACNSKTAPPLPDKVVVQLKWVHQAQFAGFYVAEKQGFYADQKIDVTLKAWQPQRPLAEKIATLSKGQSQFAIIGGDTFLKARATGLPIVAIAAIFQRNPYVYATLKGTKISRPRDLIGKKIMIAPDGRTQHNALLLKLGIDPTKITEIPFKRGTTALASGEIDVHLMYRTGTAITFEEKGIALDYMWVDDYGVRFYADTIVTTERLARENPKLVEGFLKATIKGWQYAIENFQDAVEMTLAYASEKTRDRQTRMIKIQTQLIHTGKSPIGWMDKSVWQRM